MKSRTRKLTYSAFFEWLLYTCLCRQDLFIGYNGWVYKETLVPGIRIWPFKRDIDRKETRIICFNTNFTEVQLYDPTELELAKRIAEALEKYYKKPVTLSKPAINPPCKDYQ